MKRVLMVTTVITLGAVAGLAMGNVEDRREETAQVDSGIKGEVESGEFYIYQDKGSKLNHYIPSGWMGDYGDMKFNDAVKDNCHSGTCIEIKYTAEGKQSAGWVGMFWQHPANNWGERDGGYDLSKYEKLTFMARGAKGGETLTEIKVGGITGEYLDSGSTAMGPVTLTKKWKKYELALDNVDLQKIMGGFAWATNRDSNPDGFTIYFDEIRFER